MENVVRVLSTLALMGAVRSLAGRYEAAGGARMIVLGTTAATVKPALNMAAYSLGKAALGEHDVGNPVAIGSI